MSDKWKDAGSDENLISQFIPGPEWRVVENIETGEVRQIEIYDGQTIGEAVANGQFRDKDE